MNWPPQRDSEADVSSVRTSSERIDEGLTLETSASESIYGGQFTLSTQLTKPNYLVILPPTQHHSFFRNLPPLIFNMLCSEVSMSLDNIYRNIAIFVSPHRRTVSAKTCWSFRFASRDWTTTCSDIALLSNPADQLFGIAGSLEFFVDKRGLVTWACHSHAAHTSSTSGQAAKRLLQRCYALNIET